MSSVDQLMGIGTPPEMAKRAGFFVQANGANITLQGPANYMIETSATVNLAQTFAAGDVVVVNAITTVVVNVDAGSKIGIKATASGQVVSAGLSRIFFRQSITQWYVTDVTA